MATDTDGRRCRKSKFSDSLSFTSSSIAFFYFLENLKKVKLILFAKTKFIFSNSELLF